MCGLYSSSFLDALLKHTCKICRSNLFWPKQQVLVLIGFCLVHIWQPICNSRWFWLSDSFYNFYAKLNCMYHPLTCHPCIRPCLFSVSSLKLTSLRFRQTFLTPNIFFSFDILDWFSSFPLKTNSPSFRMKWGNMYSSSFITQLWKAFQ